jgi:hypothetical protein
MEKNRALDGALLSKVGATVKMKFGSLDWTLKTSLIADLVSNIVNTAILKLVLISLVTVCVDMRSFFNRWRCFVALFALCSVYKNDGTFNMSDFCFRNNFLKAYKTKKSLWYNSIGSSTYNTEIFFSAQITQKKSNKGYHISRTCIHSH